MIFLRDDFCIGIVIDQMLAVLFLNIHVFIMLTKYITKAPPCPPSIQCFEEFPFKMKQVVSIKNVNEKVKKGSSFFKHL
jgi:hypothetical protein